ncbi:MAG TPA: adenosine deaminase [Planctomycetota bacterium]|nr:adenosine deaminase [Planctomycetota bacterium]
MAPADLRALAKIDLHCHVDGAARPGTLLELAREAGLRLPGQTVEELLPHVRVPPGSRSLDDFLATFELFYPVLAVPGAMGRVARELVEDAAADGVIHLEARFCPALQADVPGPARTRSGGRTPEDVLRETLAGLAAGAAATGCSVGAIVCCYRSLDVAANAELVRLALAHHGRGVVGLDLAGPERLAGAPVAALFARAHAAGLPITVHAGEAAGPESVREAIDVLHARRLGHGVALARDAALAATVAGRGIALECCLTSNLQTGAAPSLAGHPFDALRRAGLVVTLNTDDPAVCGTTLSAELALAQRTWGDDLPALAALQHAAAGAAFVEAPRRAALHAAIEASLARCTAAPG